MKHRRLFGACISAVMLAVMLMTGCENGNLFGKLHNRGDSGDVGTLLSDAGNALRDKNYSQALQLYQEVLNADSDNANALYGAATAAVGTSGLNFGQLLANILSQTSGAPSINSLNEYIGSAQEGVGSYSTDPDSLLYGVDLAALDAVIDTAICRLQRIISGASDGSIPSDDIAVLLDFGSLCLVRGVLRPLRAEFFDIVNNNGSYELEANVNFNTFCSGSANDVIIAGLVRDVVGAYALFNRAVTVLNLSGNPIIVQLRDDINTVTQNLLTDGHPEALPTDCITKIQTLTGITAANFQSNLDAFLPPSGC